MRTIVVVVFFLIASCKNYYNEMIHWADGIPQGTSIDYVKKIQPDFIVIDWEHPTVSNNEARYSITQIKNNRDILKMENYLSFIDNKFNARFAHK